MGSLKEYMSSHRDGSLPNQENLDTFNASKKAPELIVSEPLPGKNFRDTDMGREFTFPTKDEDDEDPHQAIGYQKAS